MKSLIILILLVLFGASLAGYQFYYKSPEEVNEFDARYATKEDLSEYNGIIQTIITSIDDIKNRAEDQIELTKAYMKKFELLESEDQKIHSLLQNIQSEISDIKAKQEKISMKLAGMGKGQQKKISKKSRLSKRTPKRLNINVDGVGVWGGKPVVNIAVNNSYQMYVVGEVVNGWRVKSIDMKNGIVKFYHIKTRSMRSLRV